MKILIFTESKGDLGAIYFELGKFFHEKGETLNLLDWSLSYSEESYKLARDYYDFVVTNASPNELGHLIDAGIPKEKLVAVCHSQLELILLSKADKLSLIEEIGGYAVVSEDLYKTSLDLGIKREPVVLEIGVNTLRYDSPPNDSLKTIGYFNSLDYQNPYGVETKRGKLVQEIACSLGLNFLLLNSSPFQARPSVFREFDCFINSSSQEGSNYYVLEAAAAGKLVISTPVGQFSKRSLSGTGIVAPIEEKKFVSFVEKTLLFYVENPDLYREKCSLIQESSKRWDWRDLVEDWVQYFNELSR